MIVGYVLISSDKAAGTARVRALQAAGAVRVFTDDIVQRRRLRSGFERMVLDLRPGDMVLTPELTGLARSLKDLVEGLLAIGLRGAQLHCLSDETGSDTGSDTGAGPDAGAGLLSQDSFTLLTALTRFERRRISMQTREGLARAQKRGRGAGRPFALTPAQQEAVQQLRDVEHWPVDRIAAQFGVSTRTIYRVPRACVLIA